MKKKMIYGSVLAMIAIILVVLLNPFGKAEAYDGGLLQGKSIGYYNSAGNFVSNWTGCTDGAVSTADCVNLGASESMRYTFAVPVDITASQYQGDNTFVNFEFYDSTNTLITTKPATATKTTFTTIPNVKSVRVQPTTTVYMYEFDVWGPTPTPTVTPSPTPTPTVTASPTATPTPTPTPTPSIGNRITLIITLTNGTLQEYDLLVTEFNAFTSWYDTKASGSGPARYTLVNSSAKGPYVSKKTSVIFDNILTFSFNEYVVTP